MWSDELVQKVYLSEGFQEEIEGIEDIEGDILWKHILDVHKHIKCPYKPGVVKAAIEYHFRDDDGKKVHGKEKERPDHAMVSTNQNNRWSDPRNQTHGGSGMSYGTWVGAGNTSHKAG